MIHTVEALVTAALTVAAHRDNLAAVRPASIPIAEPRGMKEGTS